MADTFAIELKGVKSATLRLEKFPDGVLERLLEPMQSIERQLEAAVIAAEPQKSGELRGITGGRVYSHENRIAAVVGVRTQDGNEAKKAVTLEYGSLGEPMDVVNHFMRVDHVYKTLISPMDVEVPTYMRVPDVKPHRFLRDPIEAIRGSALEQLRAAIDQAVADANA